MTYQRWVQLMQNLSLEPNQDTYNALIASYSEKHRHYHNKSHIEAVLRNLDESSSLANSSNEIELALWFHDAIYKPSSSSNEYDSAEWAFTFLQENGISEKISTKVHNLIMATLHSGIPNNNDEKLIVDIDLSILGCSADIYAEFETNVRKEYKWVPLFIYRKKRQEILNSFLIRNRIYFHDYFHKKLEDQARLNIRNAIQNL